MCDYSAQGAKTRKATQSDKLITGNISTHTRGFVGVGDATTAVCLIPGSQLAFDKPVQITHGEVTSAFTSKKGATYIEAKFVQVNKHLRDAHHDALEFPDGNTLLLTLLAVGQTATVLQLPAPPKSRKEVTEQSRAAYV